MSGYEEEEGAGLSPSEQVMQPDPPQSLMEQLRQKRQEIADHKTADIPIQGYDEPRLFARYRLLDGTQVSRIGQKVMRETKDRWERGLLAAVDTFIAACEGIYVEIDNELHPISLNGGDEPIKYEPALAEYMGYEAKTARECVFGLFVNNEIAISNHAILLNRWMGNTSREVDEDFLLGV